MNRLRLQAIIAALLSSALFSAGPVTADPFNPDPSSVNGGIDERLKEFRRDMYREQRMRRERQNETIERLQSQIEELKSQGDVTPSNDDRSSGPPQGKALAPPAPEQSLAGYVPVGVLNGEYVVRRGQGFGHSKTVSEAQYNKLIGSSGDSQTSSESSQKGSSDEIPEVQN